MDTYISDHFMEVLLCVGKIIFVLHDLFLFWPMDFDRVVTGLGAGGFKVTSFLTVWEVSRLLTSSRANKVDMEEDFEPLQNRINI